MVVEEPIIQWAVLARLLFLENEFSIKKEKKNGVEK
jgi:hypothetical protein